MRAYSANSLVIDSTPSCFITFCILILHMWVYGGEVETKDLTSPQKKKKKKKKGNAVNKNSVIKLHLQRAPLKVGEIIE